MTRSTNQKELLKPEVRAMLLQGKRGYEIAQQLKVNEATITRWVKEMRIAQGTPQTGKTTEEIAGMIDEEYDFEIKVFQGIISREMNKLNVKDAQGNVITEPDWILVANCTKGLADIKFKKDQMKVKTGVWSSVPNSLTQVNVQNNQAPESFQMVFTKNDDASDSKNQAVPSPAPPAKVPPKPSENPSDSIG